MATITPQEGTLGLTSVRPKWGIVTFFEAVRLSDRCRGFTADDGTEFLHNVRMWRTTVIIRGPQDRIERRIRFWCTECDNVKRTAPE